MSALVTRKPPLASFIEKLTELVKNRRKKSSRVTSAYEPDETITEMRQRLLFYETSYHAWLDELVKLEIEKNRLKHERKNGPRSNEEAAIEFLWIPQARDQIETNIVMIYLLKQNLLHKTSKGLTSHL